MIMNGQIDGTVLQRLNEVIAGRKANFEEGSYTCYLFSAGLDKILKKVGEEAAETIIAAKNGDRENLTGEVCDLLYHLLVMMQACELPLDNVFGELSCRAQKIGNLKERKQVDHNS